MQLLTLILALLFFFPPLIFQTCFLDYGRCPGGFWPCQAIRCDFLDSWYSRFLLALTLPQFSGTCSTMLQPPCSWPVTFLPELATRFPDTQTCKVFPILTFTSPAQTSFQRYRLDIPNQFLEVFMWYSPKHHTRICKIIIL